MTPQQRKSACALAWNVQFLAETHGLEKLGFLTLTFADHVTDRREAQRRLNSLATHVLRVRYPDGFVRVLERQKSGRIHFHLLVVLAADVRTGVDFAAFGARDYRTAGDFLRREWAFWRLTSKRFGFGRTELMPIRSTAEGIGRYVGKYVSKHLGARKDEDRGARLVEYSRGARMARTRFGWATDHGQQWRAKVRLFALIMGVRHGFDVRCIADLTRCLGPRWAHWHREFIYGLPALNFGPGVVLADDGTLIDTGSGEVLASLPGEQHHARQKSGHQPGEGSPRVPHRDPVLLHHPAAVRRDAGRDHGPGRIAVHSPLPGRGGGTDFAGTATAPLAGAS